MASYSPGADSSARQLTISSGKKIAPHAVTRSLLLKAGSYCQRAACVSGSFACLRYQAAPLCMRVPFEEMVIVPSPSWVVSATGVAVMT